MGPGATAAMVVVICRRRLRVLGDDERRRVRGVQAAVDGQLEQQGLSRVGETRRGLVTTLPSAVCSISCLDGVDGRVCEGEGLTRTVWTGHGAVQGDRQKVRRDTLATVVFSALPRQTTSRRCLYKCHRSGRVQKQRTVVG